MAEVRKQARIPFESLPEIDSNTGGYYVRYRVISEDRNRASHWSSINLADPGLTLLPGDTLTADSTLAALTAIWNPVNLRIADQYTTTARSYDIWIRWHSDDQGDWSYIERTSSTSIIVIRPGDYSVNGVLQGTAPTKADIEVYVNGRPLQRGDGVPLANGSPILKAYELKDLTLAS